MCAYLVNRRPKKVGLQNQMHHSWAHQSQAKPSQAKQSKAKQSRAHKATLFFRTQETSNSVLNKLVCFNNMEGKQMQGKARKCKTNRKTTKCHSNVKFSLSGAIWLHQTCCLLFVFAFALGCLQKYN